MTGTDDAYVCEKVREKLTLDPRVGEQALWVEAAGGKLHITGSVATEDRRRAVEAVAREAAGDQDVVNEVTVVTLHDPGEPEYLS